MRTLKYYFNMLTRLAIAFLINIMRELTPQLNGLEKGKILHTQTSHYVYVCLDIILKYLGLMIYGNARNKTVLRAIFHSKDIKYD